MKPLDGIRVVEVASWLAAPSFASLMQDMGADVVKVEPPGGESYRRLFANLLGDDFVHPGYEFDNRGKRGVVVDLEQSEGQELVHRLAADADVFVTNLTRPRLQRYRLTDADIHALAPASVYAVVSAFGLEGPDAERAGFDQTAFWARSGAMSVVGNVGDRPSFCRGGYGDHTTALSLLAATLAALRVRDATGEPQYVEVALQRVGIWALGADVASTLYTREQPPRQDNDAPANPIWNHYQTRDGRWLLLVMPRAMAYWPAFCELMGRPEWIDDPRFADLLAMAEHSAEIVPEIRAKFAGRDLEDWRADLDTAGLIWEPVALVTEVVEDAQLRAAGAFSMVDHPTAGVIETINAPFTIRGADVAVRGPAPSLGQHTRAVFSAAGLADAELDALFERGIVQ